MHSRLRALILLLIFALASVAILSAQATKGAIAGVVSDPTGAVVPGAIATAVSVAGGETRSITTGPNGEYRIEALSPGEYTVTVTAKGFTKAEITQVEVRTSLITSLNVQLTIAGSTELVNVEAAPLTVQRESGELSKSIPEVAVKDLPYSTLNPYQLAVTLPGVTTVAGRDDFTNGTSFSVNGLRPRANNFLIDGFDNNDNGIAGQGFQPNNTEAVQEVTVLTNAYAAEFGRGGGSVSNLTYRSGGNNLHGGVWEQYSGSRLNALTSEDSVLNGLTRPPQFVNNIFGFRLGGPVKKNKLFYFGSVQWNRYYGAQNPPVLKVPTQAGYQTLQGIGTNPNASLLLNALGSIRAATPAGSVAIGDRPGCPAPCNVEVGFFQRTDSGANRNREWTARVDYASASDSIFARYTDSYGSLVPDLYANSTALPYADTQQGGPARLAGAMWAHIFSPKVINEFRFSAQQINFTFGPTAATEANPMAHLPTIFLANSFGTGNPLLWGGYENASWPQGRGHKTLQLQDAISISKGTHTIKMGADLAILLIRDQIPFNSDGTINISGGGDCRAIGLPGANGCTDLANYLDGFLGPTGSMSRNFGNPRISVPTTQQAFYFQDSWKLRPNLTLDYGLRYEYQPPDASNVLPYPSMDRTLIATEPVLTRHEVKPDRNNFAPRFGFAWTPQFWTPLFGRQQTVLRGGYGMFYDAFYTNISNNTAATFPNTLGGTVTGGAGRGPANPLAAVAAITPTSNPRASVNSVDQNLVNPQTHQWNLNLQRELPLRMTAEVAYVGTRGERLWVNEQLNPRTPSLDPSTPGSRIIPARGSIVLRGIRGDSTYHGLQTSLTRSVGTFSIRGSYTWSRSLDNQSEVFATSGGTSYWMNMADPRSDRGPSAFNRTHRAAISYTYEIPFPRHKGVLTAILGGWSSSGVISFQTGTPETVYLGGWDQNGDGNGYNDRPSWGNPAVAINYSAACLSSNNPCSGVGFNDGSGSLVDWNTGAPGTASNFRYILHDQNSGTNGNVTRNNFTYPGRQDWNLSVMKRFHMGYREGHVLEFRADLFNAFNHPNLGISGFDGDLNSSTFLDINSTRRGGRSVVLWAKYSF